MKRNQFKRWTNQERAQLLEMKKRGMTANQIGEVLGREGTAVNQELSRIKQREKIVMSEDMEGVTEEMASLVLVDLGFKVVRAGSDEGVTREELVTLIKQQSGGQEFLESMRKQ